MTKLLQDFKELASITIYANAKNETLTEYCRIMGGHNLDLDEARFDLSYGDFVFTIERYIDNKLYVSPFNIESLDEVGKMYRITDSDMREMGFMK